MINEQQRITEAYHQREKEINNWRYSKINPSYLYLLQSRDREFFARLNRQGVKSLAGLKILDVGCGKGDFLNFLVSAGFDPQKCYGVDIITERIATAKKNNPKIHYHCLDAQKLPYEDNIFDIIVQYTTFTSILNLQIKRKIAREMQRVLKPDGIIFWYDFFIKSPKNLSAKAIKTREIYSLFSHCQINFKKITLAPPIMRRLASKFLILPIILEKIRILNSHYFAVITKEEPVNSGFQIKKITSRQIDSLVEIHKVAFYNYPHSFLGGYYIKKFISWFANNSDAIALVAVNNGNPVGYVVGAPLGYRRRLDINMFSVVFLCLLSRPWLLFNRSVIKGLRTRIISQIKNKNSEDAELTLPPPVFRLVAIAVDARHRRKGVGKKLFFEFKKLVAAKEAKSLVLSVHKNNQIARKFYRRSGWKILQPSDNSILKYYLLKKKSNEKS